MRLRCSRFLINGKQTAEKSTWPNGKQLPSFKARFGFEYMGSKMHHFKDTTIYFCNFSHGTPCKLVHGPHKVTHSLETLENREIGWQFM